MEALASADDAIAVAPGHATAFNRRGCALLRLGRLEEALKSFDEAVRLAPDVVEEHENRGIVLAGLGRIEEARAAMEEALRIAPHRIRTYLNGRDLGLVDASDRNFATVTALAENGSLSVQERMELDLVLGAIYAKRGDFERSFRCYQSACVVKRTFTAYDERAALGLLASQKLNFDADLIGRMGGSGEPSRAPVFILGMPRSGTTLIEQILASHPKAFGLGESDAFFDALEGVAAQEGIADSPADTARLGAQAMRSLGARYLRKVRPLAGKATRIVNKSIRNFQHAGLLHLALPNARFIHVRRGAVDSCWSAFTRQFLGHYPYTYDLGELGRYYRGYADLMDHWQAVLPARVFLEVRYEDVVADLEGQSRRMLAHCGLEWDPAVLEFNKTRRPVLTASLIQVRQPIYSSSIGRSRDYEPWLGPLIHALGERA